MSRHPVQQGSPTENNSKGAGGKVSIKTTWKKSKGIIWLSRAKQLPSEKAMAPQSSTLAWRIPGTGSLVGCSPWGHKESGTTEHLHFHFSLSCIGEGDGNPLQRSCLENPRDGGSWWAAVYGVAQSWTRLKRLSSSSKQLPYLGSLVSYLWLAGFYRPGAHWVWFRFWFAYVSYQGIRITWLDWFNGLLVSHF